MNTRPFQKNIMAFVKNFQQDHTFGPPLSGELLNAFNFFELYPMDGGGGLFSRSLIPTFDDAAFAEHILKHKALKEFGDLPQLDHHRHDRWRSIEKNCWLNRFYFIVPLAKRYAATRDEKLARLIVETLLNFIHRCPPPKGKAAVLGHMCYVYHIRDHDYNRRTPEENMADETDVKYIWFDFQPASRVLHWLYVLYFLKNSTSLRAEERALITSSLYRHAEVIYYGEHFGLELIPGNNHQSLRGLALLLAGVFFKGFGLWEKFIEEGVRLINFHAEHTFAGDGSEIENSPSYHIFVTWHLRDALLLSRKHGFPLKAVVAARLSAAMRFIQALTTPDGTTVVLNDGYAVNSAVFLKSLDFLDISAALGRTSYFPDAGLAIYHSPACYALLDASPFTGEFSHYHAGKNALTLWFQDAPFLIDSGCPPYDEASVSHWYKQAEAHSSLLINGRGDGLLSGLVDWQQTAALQHSGWQENPKHGCEISADLTSPVAEWKQISWQRTLRFRSADSLIIQDRVLLPAQAELTFIFNLHPDVTLKINKATCLLQHPKGTATEMIPRCVPGFEAKTREGKCFLSFAHQNNQQLLLIVKANGCFQSEIIFRKRRKPHE